MDLIAIPALAAFAVLCIVLESRKERDKPKTQVEEREWDWPPRPESHPRASERVVPQAGRRAA